MSPPRGMSLPPSSVTGMGFLSVGMRRRARSRAAAGWPPAARRGARPARVGVACPGVRLRTGRPTAATGDVDPERRLSKSSRAGRKHDAPPGTRRRRGVAVAHAPEVLLPWGRHASRPCTSSVLLRPIAVGGGANRPDRAARLPAEACAPRGRQRDRRDAAGDALAGPRLRVAMLSWTAGHCRSVRLGRVMDCRKTRSRVTERRRARSGSGAGPGHEAPALHRSGRDSQLRGTR